MLMLPKLKINKMKTIANNQKDGGMLEMKHHKMVEISSEEHLFPSAEKKKSVGLKASIL